MSVVKLVLLLLNVEILFMYSVKNKAEGMITRSTKDWRCPASKNRSSSQGSVKSTASTSDVLTKDFLVKVLEEFKREVVTEINTFRTDMRELTSSLQFLSDKVDASNLLMN